MEEKKKFKLHMPHVLTLIFFLIIVVAILTWILPSGEFERKVMETSAGERSVAVAGTYHSVDKVLEDGTNLRQGIAQVLMAPGKGIQQMVEVLAFVFIIGGVFQIMAKTNALNMGIQKIVKKLGAKEILIIPILMVLFGLGGSTFGMSDELIPFYLLIMPIMFAMGYDSMTTFMTVCLSATVGYAASTVNPFCVLIAQGIAGIQGNPQLVFRMLQFVIMMALVIAFVTWRAFKIKKNPEKSITYQDDLLKKKEMNTDIDFNQEMTIRQKLVLLTFVIGMVIVVVGLVKNGWYMNELSMCFLGMGILMGIFGGMNETEIAEEFINGVKDIAFAAMVIGFCSGIMVIAQDGMIIDTILNARKIYVLGIRSCAPLAAFMSFYLNLLCDNVIAVNTNSSSEVFEQMIRIGEEDVIIGISFPRYSQRTLKALEFASKRKAKIITLTDSVHSPINIYSSCNLIARSDMASIVDSLVAPLSVVNALIVALCMKKQEEVIGTLETLEQIWGEYQVYSGDELNRIEDNSEV